MRSLRPGRTFTLDTGLWVLDAVQPVAAVLDPDDGTLRRLVDWTPLPPPAPRPARTADPVMLGAAESLWVQYEAQAPLARVTATGIAAVAWTRGHVPVLATRDGAWCLPALPPQELVAGETAQPVDLGLGGSVLRVGPDGDTQVVRLRAPAVAALPGPAGVFVGIRAPRWQLRSLGGPIHEVLWDTDWLFLPDGPLPDHADLDTPAHRHRLGRLGRVRHCRSHCRSHCPRQRTTISTPTHGTGSSTG